MLRAGVYTRYSTESQRGTSTVDQLRNCTRRIDLEGWTFVKHFLDEAVSGDVVDRSGYQEMLQWARERRLDVLVVDELARAWRDQVESESTIRRLEFAGIIIVGVSDGYDSRLKARKTIRLLHNFKNEMAIDEARERTHRGQTGQVLSKFSAGGLPFGYRSVERTMNEEHLGYDRELHPVHAPIVQEIFARIAAGESLRGVVEDLNSRGVACPGARWKRESGRQQFWRVSALHALLGNEIYIGKYVWNRSRWEKDPDTKVRKRIERPKSEWLTQEIPAWRIVDDVTWQRVQRRRECRAELFASKKGGRPTYILSGLLRCGVCGGPYVICAHQPKRYGCHTRRNAGQSACSNGLMVAKDLAEELILRPIIRDLLSDEAVEFAVAELKRLAEVEAEKPADLGCEELRRLDEQIASLERLRDTGTLTPSIAAAAILRAHSERKTLLATLEKRRSEPLQGLWGAALEYRHAMEDLRNTLQSDDMQAARDAALSILGTVKLVPEKDVLFAELAPTPVPLARVIGENWVGSGGMLWSQLRIPLRR